jgi:hypothetical protein
MFFAAKIKMPAKDVKVVWSFFEAYIFLMFALFV